MKIIRQYEIPLDGIFDFLIPDNAEILCIQTENNIPYMYILLENGEKSTEERYFITMADEQGFGEEKYNYIGTYQICRYHGEDKETLHVFEIINQ